METMDLNGEMEGSTPINFNSPPGPPSGSSPGQPQGQQPQGPPQGLIDMRAPPQMKEPEKNVPKIQMDSTPINDVMGADWETASMGPPPAMPPTMLAPQQPAPQAKKANPMNLTDEQMEALLAGLVAAIAFSKPIQEKIGSMVPQVGADPTSATSMLVMGLVAAIIFYFGKRVVMPN